MSDQELKTDIEKEVYAELFLLMYYGWKQHPVYCGTSAGDCSICMDGLEETYVLESQCGHKFHHACIMLATITYDMDKCPQCSLNYKKTNKWANTDEIKNNNAKVYFDNSHYRYDDTSYYQNQGSQYFNLYGSDDERSYPY